MTELTARVAAAIQARSIVRMGVALSGSVCMDFAKAAEETIARHEPDVQTFKAKYGVPEICGELSEGI